MYSAVQCRHLLGSRCAQAEDFEKLLTIAAEEHVPVTKFLSVRSKFDTVSRTEWCAAPLPPSPSRAMLHCIALRCAALRDLYNSPRVALRSNRR